MSTFWKGKTLHKVVAEYLQAALDDIEDTQPMSIDGIVNDLCGDITIKNDAKTFVADYFDDAVNAVALSHPDSSFRYSQYERTANLMIKQAAREILSKCDTAKEYDDTYHIWRANNIEALKKDLYIVVSMSDKKFQRACDVEFESLESYTYRFLDYILPKMEGKRLNIKDLALELPLASLSDSDARKFMKSNFNEAMDLLDKFRDSGYKVDYSKPDEMIQNIVYQKEKEIFSNNPFLVDAIEYGGATTITIDKDFIEDLLDSLHKQKTNVKVCQFGTMKKDYSRHTQKNGLGSPGKVLDLRRSNNRIEILH
ncbi:MAG: hypothetical protein UIM53_03190 [Acutalibacteraceae bacterium]|nr:hypothetical protein [Acutalibacteraceae bacterium]